MLLFLNKELSNFSFVSEEVKSLVYICSVLSVFFIAFFASPLSANEIVRMAAYNPPYGFADELNEILTLNYEAKLQKGWTSFEDANFWIFFIPDANEATLNYLPADAQRIYAATGTPEPTFLKYNSGTCLLYTSPSPRDS